MNDDPPQPGLTTAGCALCAAGHVPVWQAHSAEFVHRRVTVVPRGHSFSSSLCGNNALRKSSMRETAPWPRM